MREKSGNFAVHDSHGFRHVCVPMRWENIELLEWVLFGIFLGVIVAYSECLEKVSNDFNSSWDKRVWLI